MHVAVDVNPGTDEVVTFLPSPISSYFPAVSLSCLLSYLLAELAAPVSQGPVLLFCGCRIHSKIAFKYFQVFFFFFPLLTSLVAELWLTNLQQNTLEMVLSWEQQQGGKGEWLPLDIPISTNWNHSLEWFPHFWGRSLVSRYCRIIPAVNSMAGKHVLL